MQRLHLFQHVLPQWDTGLEPIITCIRPKREPLTLAAALASNCLDATKAKGQPPVLSEEMTDTLVAFVKSNFKTRRMPLRDIRREIGWVTPYAIAQSIKHYAAVESNHIGKNSSLY